MNTPFIVENVLFNAHKDTLTLTDADGRTIVFNLFGDCCSSSYFDEDTVLDVKDILGQKLVKVSERDVDTVDSADGYGRDIISVLILTTDRMDFTLQWRNSSNGYYSGWVECTPDWKELAKLGIEYDKGW